MKNNFTAYDKVCPILAATWMLQTTPYSLDQDLILPSAGQPINKHRLTSWFKLRCSDPKQIKIDDVAAVLCGINDYTKNGEHGTADPAGFTNFQATLTQANDHGEDDFPNPAFTAVGTSKQFLDGLYQKSGEFPNYLQESKLKNSV